MPSWTVTSPVKNRMPVGYWAVLIVALFVFRLLFGLSSEFFFEDETQIFLIGLRYYATSQWPFFGPDVVWTRSEIPGALQGLLVALPLKVAPLPEAPFVLLNLISMASLAAFASFLTTRLPTIPRWLIWGWLMTIPWTLQFSTHIINPSYVLPAALVFFIGFFETVPPFRIGTIRVPVAFFMMGAAIGWLMQIHLSWPLLVPYVAYAWWRGRADGARALAIRASCVAAGALVPGVCLIPTWAAFGFRAGTGGTANNIHAHWLSPWVLVTTLARFFSFASLEINRFVATDGAKRLMFFARHSWLVPLAAIVWLAGIVQPIWMTIEWFRRRAPSPEWQALRRLAAASVLLVYASYWFVMEPPQAHAFYVLAPIALTFAAWCWSFVDSPRTRVLAGAVLAVNIAFHAGLAVSQARDKGLYKNRPPVAAAIRLKQPEMFGHRRAFAIGGGPARLADPSRPYDPTRDLAVVEVKRWIAFGGAMQWRVVLQNDNPGVAFRDLLYVTSYRDPTGHLVDERHEYIKDIFQPGDRRAVELNDGYAPRGFADAEFRIVAAEALLPCTDCAPLASHDRSQTVVPDSSYVVSGFSRTVPAGRLAGPWLDVPR